MATRTVRTVCPRNCYCTCGMLVTVDGDRIVTIEGDPLNPATGGRVCLKGLAYARRVRNEGRLLTPMRRAKGGSFERVTWDVALDDIAARLDRIRTESAPDAVLYYEGSGSHGALGQLAMAFWHQFGGCTLPYGDLCWPAGLEATRLTYGANLHNHPKLTAESRFVLLWGHNPAETNVHQMRLLLDAQERGATLALIDPRETDTSDAVDICVKPRPGTDAALALGLARVIVDEGLHDWAFLDRHATGFDGYLDRLRSYPPDRVAAITGVPADSIRRLAVAYAQARPALLIAGFGLQRHSHAGQTMRAVALLPALTGNVGLAGGGWQYANLASHCLLPPPLPPRPAGVRARFPVARLADGLAHLDDPPLRAAWIEKANPVSQSPNSTAVRARLERLDLLVVVDQFMTETAALADYVLPAKTLFEQADLVTAYWHPYVQLRAKIFDPPGEVRVESDIWRSLCERLGFDTAWCPADTESLLPAMLPVGRQHDFARLSSEPLDLSGASDVAFADHRFPTPSGKIEFSSSQAARLWNVDAVPDAAPPPADDGLLHLLTCKTRERIHSQFGNLDWVRDVERPHRLDMHPDDAAARGLHEGDEVTVSNAVGSFTCAMRLDHGLRPGIVHVLEGRCHAGDPDVNAVTSEGVTDMGHGATFYECRVAVTRTGSRA